MPSLKALRVRIKSVKNTRQITKTMKMVAAAKVRRARQAVENARPYAAKLASMMANVAAGQPAGSGPALLVGRPTVRTVQLIVCGTDRGLCGSLNANLLKLAYATIADQQAQGRTVQLVAVGRKVRDALKQTHPTLLVASHVELGRHVELAHAQAIAQAALKAFDAGTVDEVHLLSSRLVNMLTQVPEMKPLIPFGVPAIVAAATPAQSFEYEPDEEAVLAHFLPLNLNLQVFSALLETAASEQAARMTAMDSATRNAGEMIKKLTLTYNRSRQATITKELIEIISGAEAL